MPKTRVVYDKAYVEKWSQAIPFAGCWIWMRRLDGDGYGGYGKAVGANLRAHRLAFSLWKGEIPEGKFVCHHCDVRACVNPDHLFVGTAADNNADKHRKNRHARGLSIGKRKLTADQVLQIRSSSEPLITLASRFNVSIANISMVRNRKTWKALL